VALLRLSNGRVYTTLNDINRIVAPLSLGTFAMPQAVRDRIAKFSQPISKADAVFLLENLDPNAVRMVTEEGFTYRRVGNVVPSPSEDGTFAFLQRTEDTPADAPPAARSAKEIRDYLVPHHVQVNDWHFVFSGAIIKGLQIRQDLQGVVYCQAGEWIRLNPSLLNWPIFPYGEPTVAISYFDRSFAGGPFKMDLKPEVKVLEGMSY
jgi:hypothetical protein